MLYFIFLSVLYPLTSFAQEVVAPVIEQMSVVASPLIESLGGNQGVTSLAVVALIVQALMLGVNSKYGHLAGKYRFAIMYGLNALGGIMALKLQGMDTITALTHSNTMAAYQVMLNQAYKQVFKKND